MGAAGVGVTLLRVLVVSSDRVPVPGGGEKSKAGASGIRAFKLAEALAEEFEVALAVPASEFIVWEGPFRTVPHALVAGERFDARQAEDLIRPFDVVVYTFVTEDAVAVLRESGRVLIMDAWAPLVVENILWNAMALSPQDQRTAFHRWMLLLMQHIEAADYQLYSNCSQRDHYLGMFYALGQANPDCLDLEERLILTPYGVPVGSRSAPRPGAHPIRGRLVPSDAFVLLWFSGVYPWYDLAVVVRAMPRILEACPQVRLVVKGGVHPKFEAQSGKVRLAREAAAEAGLLGEVVIFDDSWCGQEEKGSWFADADLALCIGCLPFEKRFANRVRTLDFADHGLVTLTDRGDNVGDLLADYGLTVPADPTPGGIADAVIRYVRGERPERRLEEFRRDFSWPAVTADLRALLRRGPCRRYHHALPLGGGGISPRVRQVVASLRSRGVRRVALYGAGDGCRRLIGSGVLEGLDVACVVDRDRERCGRVLGGARVVPPEEAGNGFEAVLVTFQAFDPARPDAFLDPLRARGVPCEHVYPFQCS